MGSMFWSSSASPCSLGLRARASSVRARAEDLKTASSARSRRTCSPTSGERPFSGSTMSGPTKRRWRSLPPYGRPKGIVFGAGEASPAGISPVHDDRFTRSARRAVVLADEEARSLGHNYIGTEQPLLGLLGEQEGVAIRVLEALNVAPDRVREQVIRIVGSDEAGMGDRRPLTPRTRRALGVGSEEALRLGHDHVGTGHVLLGLMGESEGIAAQVLYRLGADPHGVRREVVRALGDGRETALGGTERVIGLLRTTTFRARVEGFVVQA